MGFGSSRIIDSSVSGGGKIEIDENGQKKTIFTENTSVSPEIDRPNRIAIRFYKIKIDRLRGGPISNQNRIHSKSNGKMKQKQKESYEVTRDAYAHGRMDWFRCTILLWPTAIPAAGIPWMIAKLIGGDRNSNYWLVCDSNYCCTQPCFSEGSKTLAIKMMIRSGSGFGLFEKCGFTPRGDCCICGGCSNTICKKQHIWETIFESTQGDILQHDTFCFHYFYSFSRRLFKATCAELGRRPLSSPRIEWGHLFQSLSKFRFPSDSRLQLSYSMKFSVEKEGKHEGFSERRNVIYLTLDLWAPKNRRHWEGGGKKVRERHIFYIAIE